MNNQELDFGMLEECHPDHLWHQMFSEPADFGFSGTARRRTWCIGQHTQRTTCLQDPFEMLDSIKSFFHEHCQCEIHDYLVATDAEVNLELMDMATAQGLSSFVPGRDNPTILLSSREARTKVALDEMYFKRTGELASQNKNLVYGLGDNASFCSWSAASGKVPTFRLSTSSAKYWLPAQSRWMTSKERLVAMGFPVVQSMAQALDVPLVGASDRMRAADLLRVIGNSMHLQTCGVFQLLALACYGPQ